MSLNRSAPLLLVFGIACGHPSTPVPVTLQRCAVTDVGPPVDSSWHQVRGAGFTFCVPGSWRPTQAAPDSLDPKSWGGNEGSLTWNLGRPEGMYPPGPIARSHTPIVNVPAGMTPNPGQPEGRIERLCPDPTTTPYTVDSIVVVVTQVTCHGTWKTTAWSTGPAMYVQGEARSPDNARILNAIMVTLRFRPSSAQTPRLVTTALEPVAIDASYGTLTFHGTVARADNGSEFEYRTHIDVTFHPNERVNRTPVVDLREWRFVATVPGEANGPWKALYEDSSPITVRLTRDGESAHLPDITFRVSKTIAAQAQRVGLGVDDGHFLWPIPVNLQ